MTGIRHITIGAIVFWECLIASCRIPGTSGDRDLVTSLHFSPSAFDSFRRNAELKYSLTTPATLDISIIRKEGQREILVKTLAGRLNETKGSHSVTWIGDTNQRLFAPAGIYYGVLRIQGERFETIVQVFHY